MLWPGLSSWRRSAETPLRRTDQAFTLVELLVVISIMGLIAALAVPALKNLGKSNVQAGATRQLLDDIGRARMLAISQHTTVYMVFVPTNFWCMLVNNNTNLYARATTNLLGKQLAGYNFISYGKVGDQPGQHAWHYLADWQSLPDGAFIAAQKFQFQSYSMFIPQWLNDNPGRIDNLWMDPSRSYQINQVCGFARTPVPFPTETSPLIAMPYLAFDYNGRLISEVDYYGKYHHAYVPLAQGTVSSFYDPVSKMPFIPSPPTTALPQGGITETLPGNSTNISYNIIDVDPLSGRAKVLAHQMQ